MQQGWAEPRHQFISHFCFKVAHCVVQEAALVALSADVAAALRGKGSGNTSADSTNTLLGLLASLAETNSADDSQHAKPANAKTSNAEEAQARTQQKSAMSIAAGALVKAALNAMAVSTPGSEPATAAAGFLAPASPVAAIIAVPVGRQRLLAFAPLQQDTILLSLSSV